MRTGNHRAGECKPSPQVSDSNQSGPERRVDQQQERKREPSALETQSEKGRQHYCWRTARSEEHTSELQSPDHLVCRLLLEKKKKINKENRQSNVKFS